MTPLAPHADQAVRHAVDAYIDGRFMPTFEGDATFETRNSRYRLLDGVLLSAPDASLIGAELVGWLIEYPARSEVLHTWKNGARAVLVDTRNDGIRGPHIVVTSATRSFRTDRPGSAPRLPSATPGSQWTQGGSTTDQGWGLYPAPVAPPAPVSPSWGYYAPVAAVPAAQRPAIAPAQRPAIAPAQRPAIAPAQPPAIAPAQAQPKTLPPPPPVPPPMVVRPATPPPPPPRPLPRALPPPPIHSDVSLSRRIEAAIEASSGYAGVEDSAPTARDSSRRRGSFRMSDGRGHAPAHQRGMPLR